MYEINYNFIDYNYANAYYKQTYTLNEFACSSIRKGNFWGRNFDWYYNNDVDFVVRVPAIFGRHSSIAVSGGMKEMSKYFVESGKYSTMYKIVPFNILDGINDAGVFCNNNVVPRDKGETTATIPTEFKTAEVSMMMLNRYILDNYSSATEAVEDIKKHISVYTSDALGQIGYDCHYLIGDSNKTYVLEIINNVVTYKEHNIMTNFHIDGVQFNNDGTVYTPATQDSSHSATKTNKITPYGSGLERYNIMVNSYNSISSIEDMLSLMHVDLNYNKAYTAAVDPLDDWYTEFVGNYLSGEYTVDTAIQKYNTNIMPVVRDMF